MNNASEFRSDSVVSEDSSNKYDKETNERPTLASYVLILGLALGPVDVRPLATCWKTFYMRFL